jgi:hypothetical protein
VFSFSLHASGLEFLLNEFRVAYVMDVFGNKAYVATRENAYGTQYLQTYADRVWTDNLLSLTECR